MNTENDFKIIPFPDIQAETGINMQNYEGIYFENIPTADYIYDNPSENTFAVFQGNTQLRNLDLTILNVGLSQPQNRAVLVIGDLEVDETINMFGTDVGYPMYLYVTGNVKAKNIILRQLADFIVLGNVILTQNLLALDVSCGQFSCYGNFTAKNVYVVGFYPSIKGKVAVNNFYYYSYAEFQDDVFEEIKMKIPNWATIPFIRCGESGVAYFDKMEQLYTGEIDSDELSEVENMEIEQLFMKNRVFVPEIYSNGYEVDMYRIDEPILEGKEIFKRD